MPQIDVAGDCSWLLALVCVLLPVGAKPAIAQNITTPTNNDTGTVINNNAQPLSTREILAYFAPVP